MPDKYTALWISHSRIADFESCPYSYYLKHIYKDPTRKCKIKLISPALALGSAVHNVLESLSVLSSEERFNTSLINKFDDEWEKHSCKNGGFFNKETEEKYKARGEEMIKTVIENPGPLKGLAVKIKMDLPYYWLSESDNIILSGKIDWLEYIEKTDSVNIIDFKTSKNKENENSLQLPIYHLLVHNCQKRKVSSASYWYLEIDKKPEKVTLPSLEESQDIIMKKAKKIKIAIQLNALECPNGDAGCKFCKPYTDIINGKAELVGKDEFGADKYILPFENTEIEDREGELL